MADLGQTFHQMPAFGLPNYGNSCFLNAAMQALLLTPPFREAVAENRQFCSRTRVGQALLAVTAQVPPPAAAISGLHAEVHRGLVARGAAENFRVGTQQSASELITQLLALTDPPGAPPPPKAGEDPQATAERNPLIDDTLLARFREQYRCACGHTWRRIDTAMIINIAGTYAPHAAELNARGEPTEVLAQLGSPHQPQAASRYFRSADPANPESFAQMLRAQVESLEVQHDPLPGAPKCTQNRAWRSRILTRAPPLLVLALPAYGTYGQRREPAGGWPHPTEFPLGRFTYQLVSRVHHGGCLSAGHYTASVLRKNGWNHISDSHVRPTRPIPTGTYLAVYARTG